MTKQEAIKFYRDACASKNTYKTANGYGLGAYQQHMLHLPDSQLAIANLITLGWYGGSKDWKRAIHDECIKSLHVGSEKFDLEPHEAEELRTLWGNKGQTSLSPEYARTRF